METKRGTTYERFSRCVGGMWISGYEFPRLDRGIATTTWYSTFFNYVVSHLTCLISDHYTLLLDTKAFNFISQRSAGEPDFKFETTWVLEDLCKEIITKLW